MPTALTKDIYRIPGHRGAKRRAGVDELSLGGLALLARSTGRPLPAASLLQLQRAAGNAAVTALVQRHRPPAAGALTVQRDPASAAIRAARVLGKRLLRAVGTRGSQLLYRAAARRALARLEKFGIDKAVATHIAEHFVLVPEKLSNGLFLPALRNTKALTVLITETLKKGASAPILSVTDSGALAWVFEAELGRAIGTAGKQALTKLRVVADMNGRLITAFPINSFTPTMVMSSLRGVRITLKAAAAVIIVQGIYENEASAAEADREAFEEANEPSWFEYLLPWGPSSTIGYEPDLPKVRERAVTVADELEEALGTTLDEDQRAEVEDDVLSIWR